MITVIGNKRDLI